MHSWNLVNASNDFHVHSFGDVWLWKLCGIHVALQQPHKTINNEFFCFPNTLYNIHSETSCEQHGFPAVPQSCYQCELDIYKCRKYQYSEPLANASRRHHGFLFFFLEFWCHLPARSVLALTVNLMLLRIVFASQRHEIGSYRYLIASFAVSDLSYTIVHWLVYPVFALRDQRSSVKIEIPEMHGNAFILGGHGMINSRLGACVYCAVYSQATPILIFHFVYRTLNLRRCDHFLFRTHFCSTRT